MILSKRDPFYNLPYNESDENTASLPRLKSISDYSMGDRDYRRGPYQPSMHLQDRMGRSNDETYMMSRPMEGTNDYDPYTSIMPNKGYPWHESNMGGKHNRSYGDSNTLLSPKKANTWWDTIKNVGSKVISGVTNFVGSDLGSSLVEKGITAGLGAGSAFLGIPPSIGAMAGKQVGSFVTGMAKKRVKQQQQNDFEISNDIGEERSYQDQDRWERYNMNDNY
jgi:hypothetical protein